MYGAVSHCYQRTHNHGVLFYSVRDHLVFFTIFCVNATRHNVRVLKLVQMPDHIHHASIANSKQELSDFSRDCNSIFAKEYNRTHGLRGPVFETPFGSALKKSDKDIRSNLIYLDNNPVERKLVKKAEDYRWNFLAFANSPHPFSEKIVLRYASMPLRRALKTVKRMHSQGRYLSYRFLDKLFGTLTSHLEREQLTDFIVSTYSTIEYETATSYFSSYEQELIAAHATKGSEYDINEVFIGKSDAIYARISKFLLSKNLCQDVHQVLSWPIPEKLRLLEILRRETGAPIKQIAAYLHLPVGITDCPSHI